MYKLILHLNFILNLYGLMNHIPKYLFVLFIVSAAVFFTLSKTASLVYL